MSAFDLQKIGKLTFGYEELAAVLGISLESARVTASRYVSAGLLLRLKRNCYVRKDTWRHLEKEQKFAIASLLQTPSYISLLTAMDYYQLTTQIQQDFIESLALQRTKRISIESTTFSFTKIQPDLYFRFTRVKDFFIASPEKALFDALYLHAIGKYHLDLSSIDFNKFDRTKLDEFMFVFPAKTRVLYKKLYDDFTKT
jgi:predicted transcriptional regulator of viral defense system